MTAEQFAAEYEALQKQKREIESKQKALREAYVDTLPFKVGDCVSFSKYGRTVEKAWLTKIEVESWLPNQVHILFCKPRKDGSKSQRIERECFVSINDITVINDTL